MEFFNSLIVTISSQAGLLAATTTTTTTEGYFKGKGPELQKEKPRMSTESSRASCSSSTCSTSTFSSIDCNRIVQTETLSQGQINISESPYHIIAIKEQQPALMKTMQPLDLRDVVRDSMYREARGLSIKHLATDETRGTVMKHIDSPRPSQQFKTGKPKANSYEGSPQPLIKDQECKENSKEEWLPLPRLSYDVRESLETIKWRMRHKELGRLSLDSKSRSLESLASASRSNFRGQDQHMENESSSQTPPSNQESGSHQRSSSIVAKLMGLETLQHTISSDDGRSQTSSSCPKEAFLSNSTADKSKQNQDTYSPRAPKGYPGASSPRLHNANYVRKLTTYSNLPVERAPWRQQDCRQGSLPAASQSLKEVTSASHLSSSVYGEIEKWITGLEFKQSGKDLRALKQILVAMEKSRERIESQRGESPEFTLLGKFSLEDSYSAQNSIKLLMGENVQSHHQVSIVKGPCVPRQSGSSNMIMKPHKMKDKVNLSTQASKMEISQLQRLQAQAPIYHREISTHKPQVKHCAPKNNNVKDPRWHLPLPHKKTSWRTLEVKKSSEGPHCKPLENSSNSRRSFGMASPRLRQNPLRIEEQSYSTIPFSDSCGFRKLSSKQLFEQGSQKRKQKGRPKDLQLNDDQFSELSSSARGSSNQGDIASIKSESNNSQLSETEREIISLADLNENARQKEKMASIRRKNILAVENIATLLEQPSPSSVLDDTFYNEDSPSPVEKTSTGFQGADEVEWDPKNSKHSTSCRILDHSCKYNQKLENMKPTACELSFLHTAAYNITATDNALASGSVNPHHRYITKILSTSGLLKDSNFFSMSDRLLPSCHLINPDIFHVLEQAEEVMDLKNDNAQLNKKLQRRIIFDLVDEILVRKIHSGRYAIGRKGKSPQVLLKEVYLETESLCKRNLDNANDAMTRLLAVDLLCQSEDWADWSGVFPALGLDIERQIFKDLINEVILGEVMSLHDPPKRHCKRLFNQ